MDKSPALRLRGINVRMRSQEVQQLRKRLAQALWRNRHRDLGHYWPELPPHLVGVDRFEHLGMSGVEQDEMLLAYKGTLDE